MADAQGGGNPPANAAQAARRAPRAASVQANIQINAPAAGVRNHAELDEHIRRQMAEIGSIFFAYNEDSQEWELDVSLPTSEDAIAQFLVDRKDLPGETPEQKRARVGNMTLREAYNTSVNGPLEEELRVSPV